MALPGNNTYKPQGQLGTMAAKAGKAGASLGAAFPGTMSAIQSAPKQDINALGNVTADYGENTADEMGSNGEDSHKGVDVANAPGTPIPAFEGGTVTESSSGKPNGSQYGLGNSVVITDRHGNQHRYSHLQGVFVPVGAKVAPGQQIGTMGNSGNTFSPSGGTGTHLDYRISDIYGKYVNPKKFIKT